MKTLLVEPLNLSILNYATDIPNFSRVTASFLITVVIAIFGLNPAAMAASKNTASLNFVWLSLNFTEKTEQLHLPLPEKTLQNIFEAARRNPNVDVHLWIDSKRLSQSQVSYLRNLAAERFSNLAIDDLRNIPAYTANPLFDIPETSPNWRIDKHSLIWRQVDAARVLVALQPGYQQSFYCDADVTNLTVYSEELQQKLSKHGIVLSGGIRETPRGNFAWYENQMFGFDERMRGFFEQLYVASIRSAERAHENGYRALIDLVNGYLRQTLGIDTKEIVFRVHYDGTVAHHPSACRDAVRGRSESNHPSFPNSFEEIPQLRTFLLEILADPWKDMPLDKALKLMGRHALDVNEINDPEVRSIANIPLRSLLLGPR